ncbi:MAG: NAD(P)-dependent oxidoreductase [Chloroflexi bacterium]|nr:NAD(P)-dependent oxidoreductase [Chloroflexota bacterium]
MFNSARPVLVVEDDPFLRIIQVVLDPRTTDERRVAFANFFAHDLPDFERWCAELRQAAGGLYPAEVRLVSSQEELRDQLADANVLVVESLHVGAEELEIGGNLRVVQKYGTILRNIDADACEARNVPVATLQRRANVACAEQALALMLALAKKLNRIDGLISAEQLTAAGYSPTTFDTRHTANSGWARIPGLRMLYESTLGIVGMGEIGRELALRAAAFGMRVLYYQRTPLSASDEQRFLVEYATLETLLGQSDWVSVQLPRGESTRGLIDRTRLYQMKPGSCLINTAQAYHVDRPALIEALGSGHLGGFALDTLYEEPGRADDELLGFDNVILTPHTAAQPRFNALNDFRDMIIGLAAYVAE